MIYLLLSTGGVLIADDTRETFAKQFRATPLPAFIRVTKGGKPVTLLTQHVVAVSDEKLALAPAL